MPSVSTGSARRMARPIEPPMRPRPMIATLPIEFSSRRSPIAPASGLVPQLTYILTEARSACVVGGAEALGEALLAGQDAAGDETHREGAGAGRLGDAGAGLRGGGAGGGRGGPPARVRRESAGRPAAAGREPRAGASRLTARGART